MKHDNLHPPFPPFPLPPSLFALLALLVFASPARAQEVFRAGPFQAIRVSPRQLEPEDICVLHPGDEPVRVQALSRLRLQPRAAAPTATIVVEYGEGFETAEGQQARAAFQRAVDIWERYIRSDVAIKVDASFDALGENVLGSAGPPRRGYWVGTTEDGVQSVYPSALIDALVGENVVLEDSDPNNDDAPDIIANFSNQANWYYGTGTPPSGTFDFTTVVLHELAHGLGFFGSMTVVNSRGGWGYTDQSGKLIPGIYDRFTYEGRAPGTALIDTSVYPNPSEALAEALTSENIFFGGFQTLTVNDGTPVRLYAPSSWQQGSSYSHVDEAAFPPGTNALMTPFVAPREVVHSPGAVVCGMFADMGWPLGPGCRRLVDPDLEKFVAQFGADGAVVLKWTLAADSDKDVIEIRRRYFPDDASTRFRTVRTVERGGARRFTVRLDSVGLGEYAFRLRLVDAQDSTNVTVSPEKPVSIGLQALSARAGNETTSGNYDIAVGWTVPPGTAGFGYVVERCTGEPPTCTEWEDFEPVRRVAGRPGEVQYETTVRVTGPGHYTYRLRMKDAQGHVLFSDPGAPNIQGTLTIELEKAYALSPAYPNPFMRRTRIDLTVEEQQQVTVEVYNVLGQRVRRFSRFLAPLAREALVIEAEGLAAGVYLVRIAGRAFSATRKIVVTR